MDFCRMLGVLFWKHTIVRKRRCIVTIVELVAPLILPLLVYLSRNLFMQSFNASTSQVEVKDTPVNNLQPIPRVLYTPYTPLASTLMSEVGRSLRLSERNGDPNHVTSGYWGVDNASVLENFMPKMKYNEAIVIFKNLDGETLPQNLNYTIRMKEPFLTTEMMSLDGKLTPHSSFGDIYGIFMKVQWAIDKSYLKLRTGSDLNQEVTFQEFPYLRDKNTLNIDMLYMNVLVQLIIWLSMLLPFMFQVLRLIEERASGVVELIKIVGVTTNMVGASHFLNAIPPALVFSITVTVLFKITSTAVYMHTSFVYMFVALFLFYCNIMAMAYPVSYILKNTNHGTIVIVLFSFIILSIPTITHLFVTGSKVYYTGIFPFMPIRWFFDEITAFEVVRKSIQITDMAVRHTQHSASILCALVFTLLQTALYFMLAWYLDKVRPGAYGVALPWNFLCMKGYWSKKVDPALAEEMPRVNKEDPLYFEPPPKNHKVGIQVVDVTKIFGTWYGPKNTALSHMTVSFYEGEITVLLGHNGAGKTTLMSIITGMISSTHGHVLVKGMDNIKRRDEVRRHLGFCPQNNMTYNDLTVLEHIMLFSMLKGLNYAQSKKTSLRLIGRLKLEGKENFKSSQLSGGMKRRLQLACALAGNATVLILDEPTSGLDVETRRELWNLLLSLRGTCTVVISTHFMEEADALGDRVVAIHQGQLRCRATPMYLKKAVGTGYRLSLTLNKSAKESTITNIIIKHVSGAAISDRTSTSISYRLPATSSTSFPQMFNDLETHRQELGVETIGVGVTTLDEVFLKLCSDVDIAEEVDESTARVAPVTFNKLSGFPLWLRILKVLIKRQFIATMSVKWRFLVVQVIVPIIAICLSTAFIRSRHQKTKLSDTSLMLNLDAYKDTGVNGVLLDISDKDSLRHVRTFTDDYPDFNFVKSTNISEVVLRSGTNNNEYLIGLETNNTNANLRYTTLYRHAAPVALNLYSNFRALQLLPTSSAASTITTYNYPVESGHASLRVSYVEPKSEYHVRAWSIILTCIIMATLTNEAILPCKEREDGSRHIQIMSGCSPILYWLVTLLYDYITYLVVIVFVTFIACLFLDKDKVYSSPAFLSTFILVLVLGGLAYLLFVYYVSFLYNERTAGIALMVVLWTLGFIMPLVTINFHTEKPWYLKHLETTSMMFPPYPFATAALRLAQTARANAVCRANQALCPYIMDLYSPNFAQECCLADLTLVSSPFGYFHKRAGLCEIIALIVHIFVYGFLVIIYEYGLFQTFNDKIINLIYKPPEKLFASDMVTEQEMYCAKSILRNTTPKDSVLVYNLHKMYLRIFKKSVYAVKGISFSVKKGECFGLLGVNGAGKSTTFQMLTSREPCTRGSMFANGFNISQRSEYLYSMAYCPQFGGLDMFLTGEQNLRQLLIIRGLNDSDVHNEVNIWLGCVGLQQYAKRKASGYSGGCLRRLTAAVALSSGAPVSLLDEPTTGVDTAARRRVWIALKRGLAQKRSVIITSHSMDEMEALCNRIAIMSHGEICALGSSPALRAAYGVGLSLRLKLKPQDQVNDTTAATASKATKASKASKSTGPSAVDHIKTSLLNTYPGKVRDEHSTMLHYHMNDKVPYSEIFQYMEQLRTKYSDTLEDYSVTETTLEEVFLSFARDEDDPEDTP